MNTFVIYTTKNGSYIVPKDKLKLPKSHEHVWEIDSPVAICDKRCKLPAPVTKIEDVSGILKRLAYALKNVEIEALKEELGL